MAATKLGRLGSSLITIDGGGAAATGVGFPAGNAGAGLAPGAPGGGAAWGSLTRSKSFWEMWNALDWTSQNPPSGGFNSCPSLHQHKPRLPTLHTLPFLPPVALESFQTNVPGLLALTHQCLGMQRNSVTLGASSVVVTTQPRKTNLLLGGTPRHAYNGLPRGWAQSCWKRRGWGKRRSTSGRM